MQRLFEEYTKRQTICLDGPWKFMLDREDNGERNNWTQGLPQGETVIIPSVWNEEMGLMEYEGVAWYQKDFFFSGGTARMVFEGVMTEGKVWLDGTYLGSHYGGFCQFDFIVPDLSRGTHRLVVKVDNRFDDISIPQRVVDWYHYGGITRSVWVEKLEGVAIPYARFEYQLSDDLRSAEVWVEAELYGAEEQKETALTVTLGEQVLYRQSISLAKGETRTITTEKVSVEDVRLWGITSPNLYTLKIETETDDWSDRVGFRKIEVVNGAICLNGKAIELRGVNRHDDYPGFGMAVPSAVRKKDLDIIQNLGCNCIRGSHYPNAQIFVDMLDERGLIFWSEIPIWGWGFSPEALADPRVVERGLQMHREMVRYYYNHPSILFWGMHNEIQLAEPAALEMTKIYYAYLKEHGGNRLVTYASDKPMVDICLEYCDVVSINAYYGWYWGTRDDWGDFLQQFGERRQLLGITEKPVLMSEFGGAAAYGHHTFDDVKWTEEYQANLLSICLEEFHRCPYVAGFFIWQFCDMRSDKDLAKARTLNNKGLLNEYRKPKMAYFAVREKYHAFQKEEE